MSQKTNDESTWRSSVSGYTYNNMNQLSFFHLRLRIISFLLQTTLPRVIANTTNARFISKLLHFRRPKNNNNNWRAFFPLVYKTTCVINMYVQFHAFFCRSFLRVFREVSHCNRHECCAESIQLAYNCCAR